MWLATGAFGCIQNPGNRGKGYSVRNGLLHGAGNIVMFTDADLSAPMEEAERLFAAIRDGADVAIGSRWLERSRQTIHQPLYRQIFGRCFNLVTRMVMRLPFADTQCGFKAFRRSAAQTIFQLQRIERWGFDPEILFIALKRGYDDPRSAGHVGPRRTHPHELSERRHQDAGRAPVRPLELAHRCLRSQSDGPGRGTRDSPLYRHSPKAADMAAFYSCGFTARSGAGGAMSTSCSGRGRG